MGDEHFERTWQKLRPCSSRQMLSAQAPVLFKLLTIQLLQSPRPEHDVKMSLIIYDAIDVTSKWHACHVFPVLVNPPALDELVKVGKRK